MFGWRHFEAVKWEQDYQTTRSHLWCVHQVVSVMCLLVRNSNTICMCLINIFLQRNVKGAKVEHWPVRHHSVCPVLGLKERCWENNVLYLEDISSSDMYGYFMFYTCHSIAAINFQHASAPTPIVEGGGQRRKRQCMLKISVHYWSFLLSNILFLKSIWWRVFFPCKVQGWELLTSLGNFS